MLPSIEKGWRKPRIECLELRTCGYECLTCSVALILFEVLNEASSQVFSLFFPLSSVSIGVTWVKNVCCNAFELRRNNEIEVRNGLCWSAIDRMIQDSINDSTRIANGNALSSAVPTGVDQVSLGTALIHLLHQFLCIFRRMKLKEGLTEAGRESRCGLCDAAFCTSQLGSEA